MNICLQLFRKAAYRITSAKEGEKVEKIEVDEKNIQDYMGKEKFPSDRLYQVRVSSSL